MLLGIISSSGRFRSNDWSSLIENQPLTDLTFIQNAFNSMYLSLVGANIQTANCHKRRLGEQCIYTAYSLFIEVVIWDVFHVPPWRNDKARGLVQKRHNDVWLYPTDCIYTGWTIIYRRLLIDEQIENHVCTCRKAMKAGRVFNISAAGLRDSVKKTVFLLIYALWSFCALRN